MKRLRLLCRLLTMRYEPYPSIKDCSDTWIQLIYADRRSVLAHMRGLREMLRTRGGIENVSLSPLRKMLVRCGLPHPFTPHQTNLLQNRLPSSLHIRMQLLSRRRILKRAHPNLCHVPHQPRLTPPTITPPLRRFHLQSPNQPRNSHHPRRHALPHHFRNLHDQGRTFFPARESEVPGYGDLDP